MRHFTRTLIFLSLIIMVFTACQSSDQTEGQTENAMETITIQHGLGETEVPKSPEKVVVFDFGMLDTLDYLNIPVVGVPQVNIPNYLDKYTSDDYENIGSLKEPDFEKIANIDPDLIIISGRQSELYDELSKLGPVVYLDVDYTHYYESVKENVKIIGDIFEKETEIEQALEEIDELIAQIKEKVESFDKNSLIILANDDKISAYGENSRFGIIHDVFGIEPVDSDIEASTHGMNVSFEYVMEKDPDILYVVDRSAAMGEEPAAKNIVENELMKSTKAMQNDDIYYLDADVWYLSGGGIISMQKMIEEIEMSIQ